jgi:hypothetical protein
MTPSRPSPLTRWFDRIDRLLLDGVYQGAALLLLVLAEGLRALLQQRRQVGWMVAAGTLVALAIAFVLRVPETVIGLGASWVGRH